jgi:hypothetical protein
MLLRPITLQYKVGYMLQSSWTETADGLSDAACLAWPGIELAPQPHGVWSSMRSNSAYAL